jgi:Holliday junction resolvasome RuvABC endonuclease subunit
MIAGFDPSLTHFGWTLLDEIKQGHEALLDFGMFKTEPSDGLITQRLIMQRERARKFLIDHKITFVSMEAPYLQDWNTELLFALNQFIHEVFLDLNIFVLYIQPNNLKKFACPGMKPRDITKHHVNHQAKLELKLEGKRFAEHCADAYFAGKFGSIFYRWYILKTMRDEELTDEIKDSFMGKHTYSKGKKKGLTEYTGIIYRENEQFWDYAKQKRKTQTIIEEVSHV